MLTAIAYWGVLAKTGDLRLLLARNSDGAGLLRHNPGIVRFLIHGGLLSSLNLSTKQVPLLLTGALVGTASAGAFRLASQFSQALTKLSQLISRAAFPAIVRAVSRDGVREAGAAFRDSLLYSGAVAAGIYLMIALLGRPLLSLTGPGFGPAYPILLWLAAAGCVDLITVGSESLLLAAHRAGWALAARLVATMDDGGGRARARARRGSEGHRGGGARLFPDSRPSSRRRGVALDRTAVTSLVATTPLPKQRGQFDAAPAPRPPRAARHRLAAR